MKTYQAGEVPGEGIYRCTLCGRRVTIREGQPLPVCPQCRASTWSKVK
jgi:DNA-directed RNA polymerase subunit RPC12/RpoP